MIDDNGVFFNNYLISRRPSFPQTKYIVSLITMGGGGVNIHSMIIFKKFAYHRWLKWFLKQKFKNDFGPIIVFSPVSQFHYLSLLNDIQIWNINTSTTNEDDINNFEFIYLSIMDAFHPMIYLFNPNHNWNSSMWYHSSMDIFIHVGGLKSH
jgi:hypothetical protein